MKRRLALTLLACAALLASAAPLTAEEPLDAFPAETGAVVRIASVDQLLGNVNDMLGAIGPVAAQGGPLFEQFLYSEFFQLGEEIKPLDRKAPAYAALFALEEGDGPPVAWLVQATDEDDLRKALMDVEDLETVEVQKENGFEKLTTEDRTCFVATRGDYRLYTLREDIAALLAFDRESTKTFTSVLPADALEEYRAGDVGVAVNAAYLVSKYKDHIEDARRSAIEAIENLSDEELAGAPSAEAARKVYIELAKMGFDAVTDTRWVVARGNFSAQGGGVSTVLGVQPESATQQLLAANKPGALENLELLPEGASAYYGAQVDFATWNEKIAQMNYGLGASNPEAAREALAKMRAAGLKSMAVSIGLPTDGKSGMLATTIEEAEDAPGLVAGFRDYVRAVGEVESGFFTQKFEYQEKVETFKDYAIDLLTVKFEMGELADPQQATLLKGFFDKIFGGGEMQNRVAVLDNVVVQATGNDPKYARAVLEAITSGEGVLGLTKPYAQTRDRLAADANLVMLLNIPQLIVDSVNMIRDIEPFNILLAQAPFNFAIKPPVSYTGLSLAAQDSAVRIDLYVPVEQPKGIFQIFVPGL